MTKKEVRDDIILQLTQSAPSDDLQLEESQVDYCIDVSLNALVANECNEKLKRGQAIPAIYHKKVTIATGEFEDSGDNDRVYFELDEPILELNNHGGVLRVLTDDGTAINRASIQTLNLFNAMRFAKPSESNLLYTHQGTDRLYIEGLKESDIPFDSIDLWYVPKQDVLGAADSYELLVSDLTLPMLIDTCVQQLKLELYGSQIDESNDGMPGTEPTYHQQIANPSAK